MSYASIQDGTLRLELAVLGLLIVALLAAIVLMFIHPTGALTVFALSLVGALAFGAFDRHQHRVALAMARNALDRGVCPRCGGAVRAETDPVNTQRCERCHMGYETSSGLEVG